MFKKRSSISVTEVKLSRNYSFMYENFVLLTQHDVYLFLERVGDNTLALHFDSPYCKYGGPNDEAHAGHPLAQYGLGLYGLYLVENSPWIHEMMVQTESILDMPTHSSAATNTTSPVSRT